MPQIHDRPTVTRRVVAALAVAMLALASYAAITSSRYGSSVALGTNWTTTGNMYSSNDAYSSYATNTQDVICVQGFGFTTGDMVAGSVIDGIEVLVEGNGASGSPASKRAIAVGLTKASGCALAGAAEAAQGLNATTDTTLTFGSTSSLWGTSWVLSDINSNTNFGVRINANTTNSAARNIDGVQIRVTYHSGRTRRTLTTTGN